MKQHYSIFPPAASLACALILMLAACTSDALDELPSAGTAPDALTITVSDGGMYATGQTRATERGYQTVFTEGDRIGLYVENDGNLDVTNLCLTLRSGKWTLPTGTPQLLYSPGKNYHAYYPYQATYNASSVQPGNEDFFKPVVDSWQTENNQGTYAQYTADDLMTARGVCNNYTLSFAMEHRMALLIIRYPTTKYNYDETINGKLISKSYYRYTALGSDFLHENPSTARALLKPGASKTLNISYYSNGKKNDIEIQATDLNLQSGRYTIIPIEDGAVTEATRKLQEGDFYMKDGSILPQEDVSDNMSSRDRENCLGVVFWVGEKKKEFTSHHWTHESRNGDRLLMHDHPECTHGIVVALKDATDEKKVWSSTDTESTYMWLKYYAATGQEAEKQLMLGSSRYFGYNMSRCIQWYRDYGGQRTEAYDAIEAFAKATPTPAGCSGWYFPGDDEMTVMARGTLNYSEDNGMSSILNTQFDKAGGSRFRTDDFYWSSTDSDISSGVGYCIKFSDNGRDQKNKQNTYYVRAVLTF